MGSNASEYWAESTQAWFEASVRCDVNCGLNTREELEQRDPAVCTELGLAFGRGAWRYTNTLALVAPRRAETWRQMSAKRTRVRSEPAYRLMLPICMCYRRSRESRERRTAPTGKQWRNGQPICLQCEAVIKAAEEHGLRR